MTYGELPERDRTVRTIDTGNGTATIYGVPTFLYCPGCDERYSATRGDYFLHSDSETISPCGNCGEDMFLAREHCTIEAV